MIFVASHGDLSESLASNRDWSNSNNNAFNGVTLVLLRKETRKNGHAIVALYFRVFHSPGLCTWCLKLRLSRHSMEYNSPLTIYLFAFHFMNLHSWNITRTVRSRRVWMGGECSTHVRDEQYRSSPIEKGGLTLRQLISYIYGAPSKARNANVVYIWTYVWQR